MAKGKKSQHDKSRGQRKDDAERKRDERVRRNALKKEREAKEYYPVEDDENYASFNNQLLTQGLKIKDIPGDGNCLFRSLADQFEGDHRFHAKYRKEIVDYMENHSDDFAPFIDVEAYSSFGKYLESLAKDGTFAGNDAIVAFTRHKEVDVVIHQFNNPRFIVQGQHKKGGMKIELHLAYHNGEHYSSLRRLNDPGSGPAYPYHSGKGEQSQLQNGRTDDHREEGPQSVISTTVKVTDQEPKLTPEEKLVLSQTHCKDIELVKKTVADYQDDVEGAVSFILQLMCLADEADVWQEAEDDCPSTSQQSNCRSSCDCACTNSAMDDKCHCENEGQPKKQNISQLKRNVRSSSTKNSRPTHLSNRQRKELAKQSKKKRREETKREQVKEESKTTDNQAESTTPRADLGCVKI